MGKRKRKPIFLGERPTREQMARGDIERQFVTHAESATKAMAHVSHQNAVQRWKRAGRLSDTQIAAIDLCEALWGNLEVSPRLTAAYGEAIRATGNEETRAAAILDTREQLRRIEGYFTGLEKWWDVFENVCRFGQADGGVDLGYSTRTAKEQAFTVVCFIADTIAQNEKL